MIPPLSPLLLLLLYPFPQPIRQIPRYHQEIGRGPSDTRPDQTELSLRDYKMLLAQRYFPSSANVLSLKEENIIPLKRCPFLEALLLLLLLLLLSTLPFIHPGDGGRQLKQWRKIHRPEPG